ncbi:hypothetical protein F5878DRAFT_148344 [Lentinula raphanica]|uniref:Uncharacterized protein n=1 Tax=Lentinula raphanica TaxID=153919 RepID=A0AA38P9S8_9AGAR|nr:hypothetical protein F5878DRAFT_148344 [Lentinula raphanica]
MLGASSSQSMPVEASQDAAHSSSVEDATSSLRAAALLTIKKSNKRRKVADNQPQSSSLLTRSAATDNTVQLDYGQDDADVDISSSPPEKPSPVQMFSGPPSGKFSDHLEVGPMREEGEISDSEEPTRAKMAAKPRSKTATPLPPRPRSPLPRRRDESVSSSVAAPSEQSQSKPASSLPRRSSPPPRRRKESLLSTVAPNNEQAHPQIASPPHTLQHVASSPPLHKKQPSLSIVSPKAEASSIILLERTSATSLPSSKSPQSVNNEERPFFVDREHVRPGLEMDQTQYDTAKDIVLDLLGWGVPPEYLIDCGLSREIVFYVFSELNLRLPQNLNLDGIIPYTPTTLKSLLRPRDQTLSPPQRRLSHPSLPPRPPTSTEQDPPRDLPKHVEHPTDVAALHDMERQRREELLARKAVQASRKNRSLNTTSPTTKSVDADMKDVEMVPLAPSESVDDFLRSIEPAASDKMDVDEEVPGLSSSSTPVITVQQEESTARMVESPSDQSNFPSQAEEQTVDAAISEQDSRLSRRSSSSEDTSGTSNSQSRRNGKRPVAADFVDFENGPRERSGSGLKRKTGSFANINSMRRCVIDLSDSESDGDGEDVRMKSVPVPSEANRYSTPPVSISAAVTPDHRTMSPGALASKELEIQKMRQMIAEREEGRRRKLMKLEAMSNSDNVTVKQEEDLLSVAIPVTESPSIESTLESHTTTSTTPIGSLNSSSIRSQLTRYNSPFFFSTALQVMNRPAQNIQLLSRPGDKAQND